MPSSEPESERKEIDGPSSTPPDPVQPGADGHLRDHISPLDGPAELAPGPGMEGGRAASEARALPAGSSPDPVQPGADGHLRDHISPLDGPAELAQDSGMEGRSGQSDARALAALFPGVTEPSGAEEVLRAAEARLQALITSVADFAVELDAKGRCLNMWTGDERLLAGLPAEWIGREAVDVWPAEAAQKILAALPKALETRRPVTLEFIRELEGGPRWREARVNAVPAAPGAPRTFSVLMRDITARKQAEFALRLSEERFRVLVDGVHDYAIYSLDPEGRVTTWNDGAQRLYGYGAAEIYGEHLSVFFTREDVELNKPLLELQKAAREVHASGEGWRVRKDGSRFWAQADLTGLFDRQGDLQGFAKITRDLTAWKRTEGAVRQLSGRILRLQDEERRRIARDLHDSTAQTISALAMNLALIERLPGVAGDPKASRALAETQALAAQAANEIRDLSHLLHPPDLDQVGLAAAVRWYVAKFRQRTGIRVELDAPRETRRLPRDVEIALFRVVQESLANVQRHSGSRVAAVRVVAGPRGVQVEVKDEGRGIPFALLETKGRSVEMLGVGIGGMRERVRQLGGQLEVVRGNPGTVVRASVPVAHPPGGQTSGA